MPNKNIERTPWGATHIAVLCMNKKTKRWVVAAVIIAVIGFVTLNMLAYNHAWSMTNFTSSGGRTIKPEVLSVWQKAKVLLAGVNVPRPTGHRAPSDLAADCRELKISVSDNITLDAWYCDRDQSTPLVILFHGYSAEKTSLLIEAHELLEMGASVMLVDFRGSGGSSESYTTIGVRESEDVASVVRYAKKNLSHSSTILFGQSMGAVAILKAIQDHGTQPDAVILEAVFDTMLSTVRNRFHAMGVPSWPSAELLVFWGGRQWGFNGFRHNPVDYATSVKCPALFMHGHDDPRATLDEGHRVFDAVPGVKEFVLFDDSGHESYCAAHPGEWRNAVEKMIEKTENKALLSDAVNRARER